MAYSILTHSMLFRTLVLAAGTALVTFGTVQERLPHGLAGTALILVFALLQAKSYKDMAERCRLLVEAVKNSDYSFRLPTSRLDYNDRILCQTLNRLGQLMGEQRISIEQSEHFHEQILANVSTGIVVLDEDNKVVQSNAAAANLLDLPGLSTLLQLRKYDNKLPETLANLAGGEHMQLDMATARGHARLSVVAINAILGNQAMRILVINDIHAEMDEKEVDSWIKLTRVLTHEIMNSIAPIVSISRTFMAREDVKSSPIYNGIQAIHDTSEGLVNFVDSYRKFSSLQTPSPEPFELLPLIRQVSEFMQLPSNIRLTMDIEPKDTMLFADTGLVRQMLINLLKNAVQAIGDTEGGRIMIRGYVAANEHVFVSISNNGPAIDKDVAEQIFIPFFTTKKDGNGIGLSLSRQIMKLTGGSITLLPAGSNGWNATFLLEFV